MNVDMAGEVQFARTHAPTVSTGLIATSTAHVRTAEHVILIREIAGMNTTRIYKHELFQMWVGYV